jgi:thiosulfate reductase cytochrome b subunit
MPKSPDSEQSPDPLQQQATWADDKVEPEHWTPQRYGIIPQFRIGSHWFSILWLIPLGFMGLIVSIGVGHELRTFPIVQEFIARYPGQLSSPVDYHGFPIWLRLQHVANLFLMMFIMRSGIQILADHPRLYLDNNCTPGKEWFRFQHPIPKGVVWTAKDDAVTLPEWLGIPGRRHTIGLARWWHFSCDLLWLANGIIFYILLFTTSQWQRLVPMSWEVFPNALSTALQYLSLQMPVEQGWVRYNCLQQIAYFITVFIAAPLAVVTGLMQAPAISNRLGWIGRAFNRQVARTVHFFILLWFMQFIVVHVTMVLITGFRRNFNHITIGTDSTSWAGTIIAAIAISILAALWVWVSPFTLKNARLVQRVGTALVGKFKGLMEMWDPNTQYKEEDIAPYFWTNGTLPQSDELSTLYNNGFVDYKLCVDGLVKNPVELSYAELKAMPKQEQITNHFCIQGWSGVAKWAGVRMSDILDRVQPNEDAKFAVFYSWSEGPEGGIYYDVHKIENMRHKLTILAYEMNGQALPFAHGAPLRLRCENELGFKQVKWIRAIEFVKDFTHIGNGQGGYNEDHEFFGYRMPI